MTSPINQSCDSFMDGDDLYRALAESSQDIIFVIDKQGYVHYVNSIAATFFGALPEEIQGRHLKDLFAPDAYELQSRALQHVFESGEPFCKEEDKSFAERKIWIETRLIPIRSKNNTINHVMGVTRDITNLKKTEEELNKYREYLEDLVKKRTEDAMKAMHLASIGELAAGVAHEINNPINGIINYAQLLINKPDQASLDNEIPLRIIKEGNRIARIVKGLLSFGRELGHEKKLFTVGEIINEALNLTGAQLRKDNIRLDVDLAEPVPVITANAQQLQQVFINIISNARYALNMKYEGAHEDKRLEILGGMCTAGSKPCVRISFTDYGPGISSDILEKVMSPFFTTKPAGHGTGLGLSISNGIIKEHGGFLSVESIEGEWTRIIIDLPIS